MQWHESLVLCLWIYFRRVVPLPFISVFNRESHIQTVAIGDSRKSGSYFALPWLILQKKKWLGSPTPAQKM